MIIEASEKEFNDISKTFDNALFYQTSNWGKLKSYTGWKSLFVVYKDNEEIKGCALILLKKMPLFKSYLAYSPRGFLCDFEDKNILDNFSNELITYLKSKNVFKLVIDPYVLLNQRDIDGNIINESFDNHWVVDELKSLGYKHTGFNLYYENLQPRFIFRLNIKDKSYEEILNGFKKEAKRRALKKDFLAISVRELNKDEVEVFKDLMNKTSSRRGFVDRSLSYYKQMYDALNPDNILRYMVAEIDTEKCRENINKEIEIIKARIDKLKIHEVSNAGRIKEENVTLNSNLKLLADLNDLEKNRGKIVPLSTVCLLTYGKEAIMLLAGNDAEYLQHFNASNIIVSELIKLCKQEGYDYYNFYGITGNFDPKSESYGLYTYKKQYGGEVVELIGQFENTINPLMESMYEFLLKIYKLIKKIKAK